MKSFATYNTASCRHTHPGAEQLGWVLYTRCRNPRPCIEARAQDQHLAIKGRALTDGAARFALMSRIAQDVTLALVKSRDRVMKAAAKTAPGAAAAAIYWWRQIEPAQSPHQRLPNHHHERQGEH